MNTENTDLLSKALQEFSAVYTAGKDFVITEAPLVIQEYLTWLCVESITNLVFSAVVGLVALGCIIGAVYIVKSKKYLDKNNTLSEAGAIGAVTLATGGFVCFLIMCLTGNPVDSTKQLLKVKYAPKVLLLEKAQDLVNK